MACKGRAFIRSELRPQFFSRGYAGSGETITIQPTLNLSVTMP